MKKLLTFSLAAVALIAVFSALYTVGAADVLGTAQSVESVDFCDVFSFLGYSVNEEKTSITAGYTLNRELLDKYCEQNEISNFDFGCVFGVNGTLEAGLATSFAKYAEYQVFNARIKGFDKSSQKHLNAMLSLALYIDRGNGREYVVEIDGKITVVDKEHIPTVTFGSLISK